MSWLHCVYVSVQNIYVCIFLAISPDGTQSSVINSYESKGTLRRNYGETKGVWRKAGVERCGRGLGTAWCVWKIMGWHYCWCNMYKVGCGGDKYHQRSREGALFARMPVCWPPAWQPGEIRHGLVSNGHRKESGGQEGHQHPRPQGPGCVWNGRPG